MPSYHWQREPALVLKAGYGSPRRRTFLWLFCFFRGWVRRVRGFTHLPRHDTGKNRHCRSRRHGHRSVREHARPPAFPWEDRRNGDRCARDPLRPWPDAAPALRALSGRFTLVALSNATTAMLADIGRRGALPWHCVLSSELVRAYKPGPVVYEMALDLLRVEPEQSMLVAARYAAAVRADPVRARRFPQS
ncbi:HAD-IA family hydrolase [Saccharopolyspora pogona]|uniref:HAD-IA family hydrolase n=1 Tax=Saccharopolyspora pogona TaxID=333966 RepID=UPI001CC2240C|nr:HAD-IA family hydrolase [Saccharopolyspora pogona]